MGRRLLLLRLLAASDQGNHGDHFRGDGVAPGRTDFTDTELTRAMWDQIRDLHARYGDVPVEIRLLKVTEEVGEAAEAFIGMHGLNSHKGVCRSHCHGTVRSVTASGGGALPRSRQCGRPPSRVKVVRPQAPPAGAPPNDPLLRTADSAPARKGQMWLLARWSMCAV